MIAPSIMEEPEVPTEQLQEDIQRGAEEHGERWTLWVALSCAILASLAAVASMSAGHQANEAMMVQIESANQWSYFQSKSIKEAQLKTKMELLEALGKPMTENDKNKTAEYREDKVKIQEEAEGLGKRAKHYLATHHLLARSVTLFQIAIAVGAISILTKRRAFWYVSLTFGILGLLCLIQGSLLAAK